MVGEDTYIYVGILSWNQMEFTCACVAALLSGVDLMNKVVALYQGMEAQHRVKDALYYQARLYNDLGYHSERNKCAHRFRQLDQQFPTLSQITVLGLG